MNEIEIAQGIRENTLGTLRLIADGEAQRKCQSDVPYVSVPNALFNEWEDWYDPDEGRVFQIAFSEAERDVLREFNAVLDEVCDATPASMPPLEELMATPEWEKLSRAARDALERLGVA